MSFSVLKNRPSIQFLVSYTRATFYRFPLVIIVSLVAMAYSIFAIESQVDGSKLVATLVLGIPLFLASALFRESNNWTASKHVIIDLVLGSVFLSIHYSLSMDDSTASYALKYIQLSLALHLLVSFIAFIRDHDENKFWQFNRHLFLRILLSALYSGVLYGGLAIALVTVDNLFDIKINSNRFIELWIISVLGFQTWYFLSGIPNLRNLEGDNNYPKGLRIFVQFLLIPLVSLYTAILYCYMAKILVTKVWPSGNIAWLVSIMAVLGIFNLLLINPEKNRSESKWITAYSKYYYIFILPLLVMLFVAIGKRVSEYGITEQRYLLTILSALLTGLALYYIFSKKKSIKVIPVALFVTTLISLWGPFSAYNISLKNQKERARQILIQNGLLFDNVVKTVEEKDMSFYDQKELSSIFEYIVKNHGSDKLIDWFPKIADKSKLGDRDMAEYLMKSIGLTYVEGQVNLQERRFSFRKNANSKSFSIVGYKEAFTFSINTYFALESGTVEVSGKTWRGDIDRKNNKVIFSDQSQTAELSFDLTQKIKELNEAKKSTEDSIEVEETMFIDSSGPKLARLVIQEIRGDYNGDKPETTYVTGIILIK
jgi:hypothetical protein